MKRHSDSDIAIPNGPGSLNPKPTRSTDKLLMRHVVEYVRRLGGTVRRRDGEYRVTFKNADPLHCVNDPNLTHYFTNDLLDALQTARAWMGTHPDIEEAEKCLPIRWRLSTDAERFFLDHAGYSVQGVTTHANTGTTLISRFETVDDARIRCARELAKAEVWAKAEGYSFECEPDPDADESWMDDDNDHDQAYRDEWSGKAWAMMMIDSSDTLTYSHVGTQYGKVVQSLCGCYGDDDYKRVVKAELALEQMSDAERMTEAGYDSLPGAAEDRRTSEAMAAKRKGGR